MIEQVVRALKAIAPWQHADTSHYGTRASEHLHTDDAARADRVRLHLGRGRRARDAGLYRDGTSEARRALREDPTSAWAHALLGQCLARAEYPDLVGARRALDRACALDRTNGYFVRSLLEVLDAQGDTEERKRVLATAWWAGAPVERWMNPDARRHAGGARRRAAPRQHESDSAHSSRGSGRVEAVMA